MKRSLIAFFALLFAFSVLVNTADAADPRDVLLAKILENSGITDPKNLTSDTTYSFVLVTSNLEAFAPLALPKALLIPPQNVDGEGDDNVLYIMGVVENGSAHYFVGYIKDASSLLPPEVGDKVWLHSF